MTPEDYIAFAARFVRAVEGGDAEAARDCYAPDAKIWHNHDGVEQTVDQNIRSLEWFARKLPGRKYRVLRVEALPDGYVQQHVLEATLPDGAPWKLDACIVVRIENGRITRLDEYLDSGQAAALSQLGR